MKTPSGMELSGGEAVLWYGRRSLRSLIWWFVFGFLMLFLSALANSVFQVIFFVIGIVLFIIAILKWWTTEYAITNKRVYSKTGILLRRIHDAPLEKITDVALFQPFLGRLLNYGTIGINTAGTIGYEIRFSSISDPVGVRGKIQSAVEESKRMLRIRERIEELELKYLTGEITQEQFEVAKRRLEGELLPSTTITLKKHCPQCGRLVQPDSKYCPYCGAKL